jgi:NTE family protein
MVAARNSTPQQGDGASLAVVLAGGVALGAYEAGVFAALDAAGLRPDWIAASSIGAVNGAIIAGSPPERRAASLRRFWCDRAAWPEVEAPVGIGRHAANWMSVARARLFGQPGVFGPLRPWRWDGTPALYDVAPLRRTLARLVDFDRLAHSEIRVSMLATDIETGEPVVFDTRAGDRLGVDHVLASCGFIPDFPPVEIGGRLLGDGAFYANAPVDIVLRAPRRTERVVLVIDLFPRAGARPVSVETALARRWDLIFANQTHRAIEAYEREERVHAAANGSRGPPVHLLRLCYQPPEDEAGPERQFDFSRRSIAARWAAGERSMSELIARDRVLGRLVSESTARPAAAGVAQR